jgi:lysine 2,3-aminomutase
MTNLLTLTRVSRLIPSPHPPRTRLSTGPFSHPSRLSTHTDGKIVPQETFCGCSAKLWNDWQWQTSHRIRSLAQLESMICLSEDERAAFTRPQTALPLGITPYYMSLVSVDDPASPFAARVIPTIHETVRSLGEADDPLGEETMSPVPGLVHRYPDRVLLLLSDFCSTYCRYCTRSRVVGHGAIHPSRNRLERAFAYIEQTPVCPRRAAFRRRSADAGRREALLDSVPAAPDSPCRDHSHRHQSSGGAAPAHYPAPGAHAAPYHPLWMSLHFTHPDECTPETLRACAMLADAGIPLGSQTVLLKGVNDNLETMRSLVHHLLKMRVRPYYLYQCDPITGSAHFRTPIAKGLEIIRGLRGFTSGYARAHVRGRRPRRRR